MKKPIPFGKYYLLERIGAGSVAEVFKASTFGVEAFERIVAVKRLLPHLAEDEEIVTMFIDEAKIGAELHHENIAQVFDLGKVDDNFFIALEYVHGRDLRAIFERAQSKGETLPFPLACFVVMEVCEALEYAHNKSDARGRPLNLIHRDVAPENVLIGYEGDVKLIDFGSAKATGKASKTQPGVLKGTIGYMSPEQARGLPIDKRSDIFAAGIVLYELLTGERLFIGETDFATLEKLRHVEIVPPSAYNKQIPKELNRIALKALARDPLGRFQSAMVLHDSLQSFLRAIMESSSRKHLSAWMKKEFPPEPDRAETKPVPAVAAAPQGPPVALPQNPLVAVPPRRGPPPTPKDALAASMRAPFPMPTSPPKLPPPYQGTEPYVFVSYARTDLPRITPFLAELGRDGHRLWYDAGIRPSEDWPEVIEDKVVNCRLLLVFLTKVSVDATWVRREIVTADHHSKPLLPVLLEPVELKRGLGLILRSVQFVEPKGDFIFQVRRVFDEHGLKM
jgi:eukaryotic-like serine/threonine-protein kinase